MIKRVLPIIQWISEYKREFVSNDLTAGLTVGVMLIPQGLAYAMLAGLPPVYGLYASIVPAMIYAIFGTSRQLSVGPAAMDSLMIGAGISVLAVAGTEEYIQLAIMTTFFIGLFQLLMGLFRMGFIANLLSKPVISGFTSAAAVIIMLSQVKHLFGISGTTSNHFFEIVTTISQHVQSLNPVTTTIGLIGILGILLIRKTGTKIPASLVIVAAVTIASYFIGFNNFGVDLVKDIPTGFPSLLIPDFNYDTFVRLLPLSLTMAIVAFMEAFSVSKAIESKRKDHKVKPNQELVALGASNLAGSFFQAFPVTGGFARTAVNYQSGARTPLASLVSVLVVVLTLLFLTPLFYFLPKAILAAVIVVAVASLFDFRYARQLWHDSRAEFLLLIGTFMITINFGMVPGIITGIVMSILLLLYRSANPHIARLGRVRGHHEFRNVKRFKDLEVWDNALILRIDAPVGFMNIQFIRDFIENTVQSEPNVDRVIIDAGPISHLDATAISGIRDLLEFLRLKQIKLILCDLIGPVRDTMFHTGLIELIGEDNVFIDLQDAVQNGTSGSDEHSHRIAIQHDSL